MGVFAGPEIVEDGLVLTLDAGNTKSYPGSGTTWTDLSGQGNNGTLVNGVGYSGDNLGYLSFDSTDNYAYSSLPSVVPITNPYTFELWAYWPTGGSWHTGIGVANELFVIGSNFGDAFDSSNPALGIIARDVNGGTIALYSWANGFFAPYAPPLRDTWYHIVGVFGSGTNQSKLYVNGELKSTGTLTATGTTTYTGISIGGGYYGFSDKRISNVKLYTKSLTAAEIQQNFNATRGRFGI